MTMDASALPMISPVLDQDCQRFRAGAALACDDEILPKREAVQVGQAADLTGILAEPSERLSCWSSRLPWRSVSQDGVEDGDQLPSGGNQGDELRLTGCDEPVTVGF